MFPLLGFEFLGSLILPCISGMAVMGGMGGGGIIVPMVMMFYGYTTKSAIAISGFSILVTSIVRFIYKFKEKHPEKDSTITDYSIAIMMLPSVLVGSLIGVMINVILSPLVLNTILTFLLWFLTIEGIFRIRRLWRKENSEMS